MKVLPIALFPALLCAAHCLAADPAIPQPKKAKEVAAPWTENDGELLPNGIRLPKAWPPTTMRASDNPMPVPYLQFPPAVLPIDVGRQLFVDDFLVEKTDLTRTFHAAEKYKGNPVLKPETPQELEPQDDDDDRGIAVGACNLFPGGAFYDPAEQLFKIWYMTGHRGGLALATSRDGLRWTRPNLGGKADNILIPKSAKTGNQTIWLDLEAPANERVKLLTTKNHKTMTSPDGLNWSNGVSAGKAADYCSFFYNPFRKVWAFSIKTENSRGRVRAYAESADFMKPDWSQAVYWMNADKLDLPDPNVGDPAQLYAHTAVAYESLFLGEFIIHLGPHNKVCAAGKYPKHTDLKLGFSRDGFHWSRPNRAPFIGQTGKEGDWDRAYIHGPAGACWVLGDKLYFPFTAFSGYAPDGTPGMYSGGSIGIATLRRDGFASMDAGSTPGTLLTRPVTFNGSYCFVNVNCPQGALRAEVVDEQWQVIEPYTLANCRQVSADSTIQRVTWKGAENLGALKGKPVRFRFQLTNGKLYSFWVSPDQSGASHGYVAGGGPGYRGTLDREGAAAYPKR